MNIFREFFEHYGRPSERLGPNDIPQDILNDFYGDNMNGQRETPRGPNSFDGFFGTPMDFMTEFEEMFNNFFRGFPAMPVPPPKGGEILSLEEHEESSLNKKSLQERMLSDKEENKFPSHHSPSLFPFSFGDSRTTGRNFPHGNPVKKEDRDFDEALKKGDKSLDDILPRNENQPTVRPRSSFSFFSSSVTRNKDGVIETKKTVRDSSGNEEVTITRKIGDEEYTISHKKDEYGNEETREDVINVDGEKNHLGMLTPEKPPINDRQSSLYDRIWSWFKGENN